MEDINSQQNQLKQLEALKNEILSKTLSKEAAERLGRVRAANPNLASQVDLYIMQIYQTGKLNDQITDDQMKEILQVLSHKKDTKITRK